MNCSIIKKAKIFFISVLVVLVVGLTLFSVFGFNQTVDYRDSYEVQVSVDQKVGNVLQVTNEATNEYFSQKGIKPIDYTTQILDDGMTVLYKFNSDQTILTTGLKTAVENAIESKSTVKDVFVEVSVREVVASSNVNVGRYILAIVIAIVGAFVYALIVEKLASAVSVAFSMILSAILFMSLMGITRIPASPFATISGIVAVVLAGVISIVTVNRYKAEYKKADKLTNAEIVDKVANNSKKLYLLLGSALLLTAIALCVLGLPYVMIASAQALVAGISGISSAIFGTPFMWCLIKKNK